jgi:hypothetical protein
MERLAFVSLFFLFLGWFLTASHYAHRSQRDYFFLGQWWTPEDLNKLLSKDPEMLARAFPKN